jgi:SAM-dependent methyltransferase
MSHAHKVAAQSRSASPAPLLPRLGNRIVRSVRSPIRWAVDRAVDPMERRINERLKRMERRIEGSLERLESMQWRVDKLADERVEMRLREFQALSPGSPAGETPSTTPTSLGGRRLAVSPKAVLGGQKLVKLFVDLCGLERDHRLLEVGCGGAGVALALTQYLSREGRYDGFDIIPQKIAKCSQLITPKYPNFRFQVADVYNKNYNTIAKTKASEYRFPYGDESFDFVFLTSVFTHMLPAEVENYLGEICRVLRRGGRCFITYFLLNPESMHLMESGVSRKIFGHDFGGYRAEDADVPEKAIALEEAWVRALYERVGLHIVDPIHYGRWSGRKQFLSKQDIVVAVKE